MNLTHRLAAAAALSFGVATAASAQEWPSKPIRVVVSSAAGGVADAILLAVSPGIEANLGQRFVLEAKPGADGVIGMEYAARAAPDGYTLLLAPTAVMAVKQHMLKNLGFDPLVAFEPVAMLADAPLIAVTGQKMPATSLKEFADHVRANPGKFNYGSPGAGSPTHLTGAFFSQQTGNSMVYVPYKGIPPLVQALLANDIQLAFPTLTPVNAQIRGGKLRVLAVMARKRIPELPDVPTTVEAGLPQLVASNWWMMVAPRGTDAGIIQRLAREFRAALAIPEVNARLAKLGQTAVQLSLAETAAFLKSESARYKAIVEGSGIQRE
jgi:tripartite-type tricarboxylate transporter receptor subunit TctC